MIISINLKKYKIKKELGKGGNGQVFHVFNDEENKDYTIKKILIKGSNEDKIIIENDAKILSKIGDSNNHIVKYYGGFQDNEAFYILMEYCEGLDLKKFIEENKNR